MSETNSSPPPPPPAAPPAPPPPPPAPKGLDAVVGDKPPGPDFRAPKDGEFNMNLLPAEMRSENPHETLQKLFPAYKGFRDAQANQERPPETFDKYAVKLPDEIAGHFPDLPNDPAFKILQEGALAMGVAPSKFEKGAALMLQKLVDVGVLEKPIKVEDEIAALGGADAWKPRHAAALAFVERAKANKLFGDDTDLLLPDLQAMTSFANGVKLIEHLAKGRMETGPGGGDRGGGGAISVDDIKARMRDARYDTGSPTYDAAFRKETDDLNRAMSKRS